MSDLYQDEIMDHYRYPRNRGRLDLAERSYEDQNPLCGDTIRVDLAFAPPLTEDAAPEERRIAAIRFDGRGCAISLAAASMLTELVAGRTVAEARAFGKEELLAELGITLSPMRLKCALLALKVFKGALYGLAASSDSPRAGTRS